MANQLDNGYSVAIFNQFIPQDQFPDYPELLRMSISLGRRVQEPLLEFASLTSSLDNEILSLKMHPLQGELLSDQLKGALEEELVTRVNDVGVDVHYIQDHPHAMGMLQYACGLGPRKAAAILKVCVINTLMKVFIPHDFQCHRF